MTSAGYLTVLIVFPPVDDPTVVVLALVPLVVAGSVFGLRYALVVAAGLIVATGLVVELVGRGIDNIVGTYRGIPLLMFVMTGIVVGRLRDVRTTLEYELEHRKKVEVELRDTQRRLEQMLNAKDELIASVGHELRTPLTAVLGFAEMLRIGNQTGMAAADRTEMVDFIAREAFDLSGIIDDLLVAARIEIGKLEIAKVPTALRAQVAQVLEGWDPLAVSGVTVTGNNAKASADPARVRQILRNLIANALRYGGDSIEVRIGFDDSEVLVEVRDDGPGLPQDQWETIFEPYYRYHSEITQPGAVGLGLTVSRGLAELMDGRLTYRHDNGTSVFTLRLPQSDRQIT
ncbi:MAG: HAMP domain-containing sensor histidine kinase [Acidimicrobiia bacterium]